MLLDWSWGKSSAYGSECVQLSSALCVILRTGLSEGWRGLQWALKADAVLKSFAAQKFSSNLTSPLPTLVITTTHPCLWSCSPLTLSVPVKGSLRSYSEFAHGMCLCVSVCVSIGSQCVCVCLSERYRAMEPCCLHKVSRIGVFFWTCEVEGKARWPSSLTALTEQFTFKYKK